MKSWNLLFGLLLGTALSGGSLDLRAQVTHAAAGASSMQPGDIVRLRIWREPDLSGDFPVDEAGIATFPKLGPMSVTSNTVEALRAKLVALYQEFLRNPSVDVVVLKRINVLGAVKNPGLYPIDPTMTIADAVALAGGATPDGDRRRIELLRGGERQDVRLTDQSRVADLPLRSGDQLFVPEKSWISRNPTVVAASLTAAASLIVALLLR
jgi:polysaccharide export outer membrane protein